ncbi:hypothetical protein [Parasphaerochaeta coccoides]|uniref:Uncharacterized protein n=1 Tax=Parasphaerochaeta coccoides (strain ATCC BAA-1237 / DSM 17374 / SPN1) TaxID=760011 RepID=F4GIA2_PARC1|nr:hypothetical protein [Parasphaerochaeta coccoides]AEC01261.1 hypothetical protein Spico_0019 [Parasphaerochaeta coccoides DSM 17374]
MKYNNGILYVAGVDKACERVGLDFNVVFGDIAIHSDSPYRNHDWQVRENKDFIVINAVPDAENVDCLFWEEWYLHEGEIHHHLLSLWKPEVWDEQFIGPEDDDLHPDIAFSRTWYVRDLKDMTPVLLRR